METLLNLIWLAVTVAGVCLWRFRWFGSRENKQGRFFPEAIAIVCVLALLFPVISLTDDLHPDVMVADVASAKRNHVLLVAGGAQTATAAMNPHSHTAAAVLVPKLSHINLTWTGEVVPQYAWSWAFSRGISAGRSPPSFL